MFICCYVQGWTVRHLHTIHRAGSVMGMRETENATKEITMTDTETLDMNARYAVAGYGGVAFYLLGYSTTEEYDGDVVICEDDECDHGLSDMCWAEGETSIVTNLEVVRAVMVGDDREHLVDVGDLTKLGDDAYCSECGQVGCTADGRSEL